MEFQDFVIGAGADRAGTTAPGQWDFQVAEAAAGTSVVSHDQVNADATPNGVIAPRFNRPPSR